MLYTEYGNNELFIEKAKTRHLALQREAKIRNEEEIVHSFAVKKSFSDLTGVNAVVRHAGPAGPHIYDIYIGTPQAPLPAASASRVADMCLIHRMLTVVVVYIHACIHTHTSKCIHTYGCSRYITIYWIVNLNRVYKINKIDTY